MKKLLIIAIILAVAVPAPPDSFMYSGASLVLGLDTTGNYWGTDVADSISSWIDDANDHPQDSQYWMEVIYLPFADDPVAVQRESLSDLKALFR